MPSISPLRMKFVIFAAVLCLSSAAFAQRYSQTNLVSDISGLAAHTDSRLVNPWGISFGPTSPFWIADNGTGLSTLYEPDGSPAPFLQNGVVIPPPAGGSGSAATGTVFDSTGRFVVSANGLSGGAVFIFASEDGTISGRRPAVDSNNSLFAGDSSACGAVYRAWASAPIGPANLLYA